MKRIWIFLGSLMAVATLWAGVESDKFTSGGVEITGGGGGGGSAFKEIFRSYDLPNHSGAPTQVSNSDGSGGIVKGVRFASSNVTDFVRLPLPRRAENETYQVTIKSSYESTTNAVQLNVATVLQDAGIVAWDQQPTVQQTWATAASRSNYHTITVTNEVTGTNDIDLCISPYPENGTEFFYIYSVEVEEQ